MIPPASHRLFPTGTPPASLTLTPVALTGRQLVLAVCRLSLLDEAAVTRRLGDEERQRLAGLRHARRRREWLGGRLAAKEALAGLLLLAGGIRHGADIEIRTGRHGEPQPAAPALFVSISHSGDYAAALASRQSRCGLDLQVLTPSLEAVRSRYCGANELRLLAQLGRHLPPLARLGILWTTKEAHRKAAGGWPLPSLTAIRVMGGSLKARHLELHVCDDAKRSALTRAWLADDAAWAVTCISLPGTAFSTDC